MHPGPGPSPRNWGRYWHSYFLVMFWWDVVSELGPLCRTHPRPASAMLPHPTTRMPSNPPGRGIHHRGAGRGPLGWASGVARGNAPRAYYPAGALRRRLVERGTPEPAPAAGRPGCASSRPLCRCRSEFETQGRGQWAGWVGGFRQYALLWLHCSFCTRSDFYRGGYPTLIVARWT